MIKYILILFLSFNLFADYDSDEEIKESNPNYNYDKTNDFTYGVINLIGIAIFEPEKFIDDKEEKDKYNRDFKYLEEIDKGMRDVSKDSLEKN